MENEKTIYELTNEKISFLVPSYQRGYRWCKINVLDLLNDLYEFIQNDKSVYSLQPLVVYKADESYHIVDGQQRLTTISVLLYYLGLKQITIRYETRAKSQKNQPADFDNIDQYHVNQAYDTIKDWFATNDDIDVKKKFIEVLQDKHKYKRIKFIWYPTTDDEIATFIRLNKDKISLTNAELIKAMLLKKGNFDGNSELRQKSIAVEWNMMENTLNDDAFWCFARPYEDNRETRIDFLFEIIKDSNFLNYKPKEDVGNDRYSTFRYFYSYFKEHRDSAFEDIWDNTYTLYNILLNWYNEIELYHYIGFLITFNSDNIISLLETWMKPGMTIDSFKKYLKDEINKVISNKGCNKLSKQYKYNEERGTDKTYCTPILLLFNIQRIIILNRNMNKKSGTQLFNKFPFYLYKSETWNVEHIASNTDNDLSQPEEQKEWLKTFLLDESISNDIKQKIKDFLNDPKDFDNIQTQLEEEQSKSIKKEEHMSAEEKNQIWNFCLLDEHTNKSYGNSIFPVKRRMIMGKEMGKKYKLDDELNVIEVHNSVAFVPTCTKDVFIKAYTANDTSNREWSRTDALAYRTEMLNCLKNEFNVSL